MSMSDNDFFGEYLFKPEEKNQELTKVDGLDQRQAALREMFQVTYAGDIWEILGRLYDAGYRRAALATQPAYYHDMVEAVDVLEALADGYERGYQDGQSNPSGYNDKLAKHRVAAELLAAVRGAEHE